ncbi:hypothetical protein BJ980_003565 [Nocardioides daedukensis]|uniref:Uncharacterized protein n=1 Tax=Nocardioides daedukensis TaxID=634462 RepID=A0A7Y9URQ6_9ACTN|nr:hypothetical protein [Nocardioides daedukensis]NYG60642.1 hypothetical protein [Nocardioides daedukensis]
MPEPWIVGAAAVVVIGVVVGLLATRHKVPVNEPQRLWTVSRANTSDGVTARLEVEVVVELAGVGSRHGPVLGPVVGPGSGPAVGSVGGETVDLIESAIRRRITEHPVASLPSVGDEAPFLPEEIIQGVRIVRAVVTASDVEVTPELRRLVTDRSHP